MREIEIKLQLPAGAEDRVRRELALGGATGLALQRLDAIYFDTPARALARSRAALRLRCEDGRWVQTFKAAADNALVRLEDNRDVDLGDPSDGLTAFPALDLYGGSEVGARLEAMLGWVAAQDPQGRHSGLKAWYGTAMRRTRAHRDVDGIAGDGNPVSGSIELALDLGEIRAGELALRVSELEIESLSGDPRCVLVEARRWVDGFGLWLDLRSKAQRGDALARTAAAQSHTRHRTHFTQRTHRTPQRARRSSLRARPASSPASLAQALSVWTAALSDASAAPDSLGLAPRLAQRWLESGSSLCKTLSGSARDLAAPRAQEVITAAHATLTRLQWRLRRAQAAEMAGHHACARSRTRLTFQRRRLQRLARSRGLTCMALDLFAVQRWD